MRGDTQPQLVKRCCDRVLWVLLVMTWGHKPGYRLEVASAEADNDIGVVGVASGALHGVHILSHQGSMIVHRVGELVRCLRLV